MMQRHDFKVGQCVVGLNFRFQKMDLKMDLVENPWHIRLDFKTDKVLEIVHKVLDFMLNIRLIKLHSKVVKL